MADSGQYVGSANRRSHLKLVAFFVTGMALLGMLASPSRAAGVLGLLGALTLMVLPGCWVSFTTHLPTATTPTRLAIGVTLSPLVVAVEFYLLRLLGVPFPAIAVLLPLANAPVLWLVFRNAQPASRPDLRHLALWTAVLIPPAAFLFLWMHETQFRANYGHAWTHTDIIYMLANGALRPEEPQLAGIRLAYPWMGHVYQGLSSFLVGTAPSDNYLLTNGIWLLSILALVAAVSKELGGNRLTQVTSALWLCFAVNLVGYSAVHLLPSAMVERYSIWGDWRYAPWIRKFGVFEPTVFGIGMCATLVFLLAGRWPTERRSAPWLPVLLALCGLGIIYPVLFPAGLVLLGAKLCTLFLPENRELGTLWRPYTLLLVATAVLGGLVAFASLLWITADRVSARTVGLYSLHGIKLNAAMTTIVLAPLLIGFAACSRRLWHSRRSELSFLMLGGLGVAALSVLFVLYNVRNEYKYIFVSAFCLAPFPALALEPALSRLRRGAFPLLVLVALILFAPAAHRMLAYPDDRSSLPAIDTGAFDLRLAPGDPYREVCDAIRKMTPTNAILVARRSDIDLVTLTRRPLYVPYESSQRVHGIGLLADYLLERSRGYDPQLVKERRRTLRELFESENPSNQADALDRLLDSGRPLAVIVDRDARRLSTLLRQLGGIEIAEQEGISAWLIVSAGREYGAM